jgi:hypothetical protein
MPDLNIRSNLPQVPQGMSEAVTAPVRVLGQQIQEQSHLLKGELLKAPLTLNKTVTAAQNQDISRASFMAMRLLALPIITATQPAFTALCAAIWGAASLQKAASLAASAITELARKTLAAMLPAFTPSHPKDDPFPVRDPNTMNMTPEKQQAFRESFESGSIAAHFRSDYNKLRSEKGREEIRQVTDEVNSQQPEGKKLTKEETLALHLYSSEDYRIVNHTLDGDEFNKEAWLAQNASFKAPGRETEKGKPLHLHTPKDQEAILAGIEQGANQIIEGIASALNKLPPYDKTVYRQVRLSASQLEEFKAAHAPDRPAQGHHFVEKKFLSCSTEEDVALNFKPGELETPPVIYVIEPPFKGAEISKFAKISDESEVLINCGSAFVSTGYKEMPAREIEIPELRNPAGRVTQEAHTYTLPAYIQITIKQVPNEGLKT